MPDWKFGDLMRYPIDLDPDDPPAWVFMFIGRRHHSGHEFLDALVVQTHWQDDLWVPGVQLVVGVNEMVPLK